MKPVDACDESIYMADCHWDSAKLNTEASYQSPDNENSFAAEQTTIHAIIAIIRIDQATNWELLPRLCSCM